MDITQIEYHWNGVDGAPFHVVRFTDYVDGHVHNMAAFVFDQHGYIAVIDTDLLAFGVAGPSTYDEEPGNTWRGDHFERQMREAIYTKALAEALRDGERLYDAMRSAESASQVRVTNHMIVDLPVPA